MRFLLTEDASSACKQLFESLRNSLTCATIAVAGVAINRYPVLSILGIKLAPILGILIVYLAALLFMLNLFFTCYSFQKNINFWSYRFWLVDIPVFTIYVIFSVSIFGAAVKLSGHQLQIPSHVQSR